MQVIAKVGETVYVTYQAKKATSGLTDVTMEIFDETNTKDLVNYPDVIFSELGSTGVYCGSFAPDAAGKWTYRIDSVTKSSSLPGSIIVTNNNLDSLGDAIAALNNLSEAAVQSIIDSAEANIRGIDDDTLKTISDQLDDLEAPAVLG